MTTPHSSPCLPPFSLLLPWLFSSQRGLGMRCRWRKVECTAYGVGRAGALAEGERTSAMKPGEAVLCGGGLRVAGKAGDHRICIPQWLLSIPSLLFPPFPSFYTFIFYIFCILGRSLVIGWAEGNRKAPLLLSIVHGRWNKRGGRVLGTSSPQQLL